MRGGGSASGRPSGRSGRGTSVLAKAGYVIATLVAVVAVVAVGRRRVGCRRRSTTVPVYEFRCSTCHAVFDERRPMADADRPATCPDGHRC